MNIVTGSRESCIEALICTWLSFPARYCNNCGKEDPTEIALCAEKGGQCLVGTNKEVLQIFFDNDLRLIKETRKNKWASSDNKSIRMTAILPQSLYRFLDDAMQRHYNEHLFTKEFDQNWFARKFPKFQVPMEI